MKKLIILLVVATSFSACKKENKEFTKEIKTEGDGAVITVPYAEINADKIFKGKKIKTNYSVSVQWFDAGTWQSVDLNNFAGGRISTDINKDTGDLTVIFDFAPFGEDRTFKIIVKE